MLAEANVPSTEHPVEVGVQEFNTLFASHETLLKRISDTGVSTLTKQEFQSKDFVAAGYNTMPEQYGLSDRQLWILTMKDSSKWIIAHGKISSDNPYEIGHAVSGGIDLRKSFTAVIKWENDTITFFDEQGNFEDVYTGEYGKLDFYLDTTNPALGTPIQTTHFV